TNGYPPEALAELAISEGIPATVVESVPHALHLSQSALAGKGRVLICGSLYLAGHVLKLHAGGRHV
ncbi:MAG TPA: bifunctional folylpolyglutamate synthase/dihydrofolate synthase, partial [Hyphomicrobium sp.]|nr:bifunctional folylpolyglutamate synthase/dihydrofolate synthase [Hyphomicrobium sp.]